MSPRTILVAAVAVIAIVTGTWLSFQVASPPAVPNVATVLPAGNKLPDFSLLDHTGAEIGRDVFAGHWSLLFFGFTHCPDICPMTLQVLSDARKQLQAKGHDPLPRIVLVSVDPERDTPEKLAQYVGYFGENNLGITGDLDELTKFTGELGIWFEKSEPEGDTYAVNHSAAVLMITPDMQFRALFGAPHKAENYVHDLPIIMSRTDDTAPITVSEVAIARPKPGMQMTAGYFTLSNHTSQEIVVSEVRSPQFGSVQMHESVIDDGIARMAELDDFVLQAGSTVEFRPGGKHLMLMQAVEDLDEVTLEFFAGESIILSVNVKVTD